MTAELVILLLAGAEVRVSVAQNVVGAPEQRDVTAGGCTCRQTWSVAVETCDDGDVVYRNCGMPEPCDGEDGDRGYTWCYIDEPRPGCMPVAANWDYCLPGVVEYPDPPPPPCSNDDLFAFDCPERVWMLVGTLVLLCGSVTACGVVGLRRHLRHRRAASKYGSDVIEDISSGQVRSPGGVEPADEEERVKASPGLELLGRGVRLEIAPHLVAAVAAQPPSEVIPCGELTQVAIQPLGQVVAPAVLGQEPDGVFRPKQTEGRKSRYFVPAGVTVDGVRMQSFLSVHAGAAADSECSAGGAGRLLSSVTLSSKRGLDTRVASGAVVSALAAMPALSTTDPGQQMCQTLTLQLHLERFRLRFKPSLPERGEQSLDMEFLPCLARHMTAAEMGLSGSIVSLSAPPLGNEAAAHARSTVETPVESMGTGDTEDEGLAAREPLVPELEPEPESEPEPKLVPDGMGASEFSQRYGDRYIDQVFCGGHVELQLSIALAEAADTAAIAGGNTENLDNVGDDSSPSGSVENGNTPPHSLLCNLLGVYQSGGLSLHEAFKENLPTHQPSSEMGLDPDRAPGHEPSIDGGGWSAVHPQPQQLRLGQVLNALSDWHASILRFNDPVPVRLGLSGWRSLLPGHEILPSPTEPPVSRLPPLAVPQDRDIMLPSPGGDAPSALPTSIASSQLIGSRIGESVPISEQQLQGERPGSRGSSQGDSAYDSLGSDFAALQLTDV